MSARIKQIFVNLPIKDITKTRDFWTKLGFSFNPQFSDDNNLCLILDEGHIYVMLLTEKFFSTFTNRPIADGSTTQVLLSIDVGSRARLDEVMRIAFENGAVRYMDPIDMGWMYADRFSDPDGHQWEILWMDEPQIPKA